jgi:hypothetical protein
MEEAIMSMRTRAPAGICIDGGEELGLVPTGSGILDVAADDVFRTRFPPASPRSSPAPDEPGASEPAAQLRGCRQPEHRDGRCGPAAGSGTTRKFSNP